MDKFEKKYGFKEDEKVKNFHRSRRMFAIIDEKLLIAKPNLPHSHAKWFEESGYIGKQNDQLMNSATRGVIDDQGDVYFYSGYDFNMTEKNQKEFFEILPELAKKLDIKSGARICGGLVKKKPGEIWPARKIFGTFKEVKE